MTVIEREQKLFFSTFAIYKIRVKGIAILIQSNNPADWMCKSRKAIGQKRQDWRERDPFDKILNPPLYPPYTANGTTFHSLPRYSQTAQGEEKLQTRCGKNRVIHVHTQGRYNLAKCELFTLKVKNNNSIILEF